MCLLPSLKWSSTVSSLGIVQWDFTRLDHLGNPGRVSGLGPVNSGRARDLGRDTFEKENKQMKSKHKELNEHPVSSSDPPIRSDRKGVLHK